MDISWASYYIKFITEYKSDRSVCLTVANLDYAKFQFILVSGSGPL